MVKINYDSSKSFSNSLSINRIELVAGESTLADNLLGHRTIKQLIAIGAIQVLSAEEQDVTKEILKEEAIEVDGGTSKRNSRRLRSTSVEV
ncbi:MAG: hypothetical protein ACRC80_26695 [Waterburya sp.]